MSLEFFYKAGWSVIPCSGKRPIVEEWQRYNGSRPTEAQIDLWDEQYPECNVGLCVGPASGIIALDVDIADEHVHKNLAPHTTLRRHGRPGRMMYFYRWNGEQGKKVLGGVEIYYSTGQVIVDGTHPDTGGPYRLLVPEGLSFEEAVDMLPEFPSSAELAIKEYLDKMPKEEKERKTGAGILGVGRNASLASMAYHEACFMLARSPVRTEEDIVNELLSSEWASWFSDPTEPHGGKDPRGEARKMVKRAIKKSKENGHFIDPTGFENAFAEEELHVKMAEENVEAVFSEDRKSAKYKQKLARENRRANEEAYKKAKTPPLPDSGIIRDIYELSRGFYTEIPAIAIAAGIHAASVFGSKRFFSGSATSNEYIFIIAPTASGKSFAHDKVPERLFKEIESLGEGVLYSRPVSLPAVVKDLKEYRHITYCLKEAEVFLASLKTNKNNTGMDVGNAILQLFDNTWLNKPTIAANRSMAASKDGGIQSIKYPFLNLLCCTTIHQFKNMADKDSLSNGIFGRFLVFPHGYKKNQLPVDNEADWRALKTHMSTLCAVNKIEVVPGIEDKMPEVVLAEQLYIPIEIPLWDYAGFMKMADSNCDEIACISDTDPRSGIAGRFAEHLHKLALLYCISEIQGVVVPSDELLDYNGFKFRRAKTLKIMPRHVEWARQLFFWMLDELEDIFEEIEFMDERNSSFLSHDKALSAIEHIKKVGSISWRDLSRRRSINVRSQSDFLKICGDYNIEIKQMQNKTNGRTTYTFHYKGE